MTRRREVINDAKPTDRGRLFLSADGRSVEGRRWNVISQALIADHGGEGKVTETERLLLRNLATLMLSAEKTESLLIEGSLEFDAEKYSRLCGQINRSFETLNPTGASRKVKMKDPRDFDGTLEEYMAMEIKKKEELAQRSKTK